MERIIVSRHKPTAEFIKRELPEFENAPVLATATTRDVRSKIVAGNIPLHLAAAAHRVWAVEFTGNPPRGTEFLTLERMDAAGAKLTCYEVFVAVD